MKKEIISYVNKINNFLSESILVLQHLLCSEILSLFSCNKPVASYVLLVLIGGLLLCLTMNPEIINVNENIQLTNRHLRLSQTCVVEGGIHESTVPEVCVQWSNVFKNTVLKEWIFKGYWFKLHHNKPAQYKELLSIYLHSFEIATDITI